MIFDRLSGIFLSSSKKKTMKILETIKEKNPDIYDQIRDILKSIDHFEFKSEKFQCDFEKLKKHVLALNYKEQDAKQLVVFSLFCNIS